MTDLFLKILNMSASASVVIVAVLGMRLLLRKAPKKWSYLLWSVVAFRLCCPVSLQAAFSVFHLQPIQPTVTQAAGQATAISYIPQAAGAPVTPPVTATAQAAIPSVSPDPMQYILTAAAVVWCIGMAALLIYCIASYVKAKNTVLDAVRMRDNIYESDRIRSPFILGLLRPNIYIPLGLDTERMRYVLAHERNHIKRLDHLVKTFAFLLLTLHWFNPLCWLAFYLMSKDMEMSCDEMVLGSIRNCGKTYSNTLLSFAAPGHFLPASPLAFGETSVKSRIKNSLNWKQPKYWMTLTAAVLCIVCLAACAVNPLDNTTAAPDPTEPSTEQTQPTEEHTMELVTDPEEASAVLEAFIDDVADPYIPLAMNYGYDARFVDFADAWATEMLNFTFTPASWTEPPENSFPVLLELTGRRQFFAVYEGGFTELRDGDKLYHYVASDANDTTVYEHLRNWFDQVEYDLIYSDRIAEGVLTVEDNGQTYLEAALEACEKLEHIYLETTPGSRYRYSYVSCSVEAAEEQTEIFRQSDGDDQILDTDWCFVLTTVFVPENARAAEACWAGNTDLYTGDDVPYAEGSVYESKTCGYVSKADDGWHVALVGTGW